MLTTEDEILEIKRHLLTKLTENNITLLQLVQMARFEVDILSLRRHSFGMRVVSDRDNVKNYLRHKIYGLLGGMSRDKYNYLRPFIDETVFEILDVMEALDVKASV